MKKILFLALLIVGCAPKKKMVVHESRVLDSVVYKVETVKAPLLSDVLTIPEICEDSVAVEFERVFVRDTDTVVVTVENNSLVLRIQQQEKKLSEASQQLQIRESEVKELRNTTKYRTHWGLVLGSFFAGLVIGFLRPWKWV